MGYVFASGPCFVCGDVFSFSAERVPSIIVDDVRRPICSDCVEVVNREREAAGNPPIVPLPGAYDPDEVG
jgi:hypothetical protein